MSMPPLVESIFERGMSKLCWHRKHMEKATHRTVHNNVALEKSSDHNLPPQSIYKSNKIKTTKYTVLTFVPKNLFEQFHRYANIYFLFIALLNWIPEVNAFLPEISLIPVLAVLAVTGIKDGYEDYRRYKQDTKVNHSKCLLYKKSSRSYEPTEFYKVLVGDIVKVKCNEVIPADLLLLGCSEDQTTCFIETANLDGESNLKQRSAVPVGDAGGMFSPHVNIKVECETPNAELNKFKGTLFTPEGQRLGLSKDNLLLRGCVLRNTDFIEGIVIYAGHDTKAMKNSSGPRYKRSKLERHMNRDVIWCLVILLFLCFFSAIGSGVWLSDKWETPEDVPYIPSDDDVRDENRPALEGFYRFWTFIIIYQVMIPLSLYATLEIVKSCQVYFIHMDRAMYYDEKNIPPVCRALNITEELGQVQHIFSDKTGTLTENKMEFKACSIGEMLFREPDVSSNADEDTQIVGDPLLSGAENTSVLTAVASNHPDLPISQEDRLKINEFLTLLATCNTVVVSSHSHNMGGGNESNLADSVDSLDTNVTNVTNGVSNNSIHRFTVENGHNGTASANTLDVPVTTFTPVKTAFKKLTERIRRSFVGEEMENNISLNSMHLGEMSMLSQKTLTSRYEAESPDELALVKAVCKYGCRLLSRTHDSVSVHLPAEGNLTFQVLEVLPFDSVRKCMSVVMRNEQSGEIILYTKGADNVIFDKVLSEGQQGELLKRTRIFVNHFAKDGLRTLCMAKKVLSEEEFRTWHHQFNNCDLDRREEEQFRLCNELETGLELLGATGIEDKLQEGVAEAIHALEMADIKVWVLTGDKQETAINIGYSCGLLPQNAAILTLNVPNVDEVESVLNSHLEGTSPPQRRRTLSCSSSTSTSTASQNIPKCLVVDGKTLSYIFKGDLSKSFLRLADNCLSVLCCRTTPSQKAEIVELVKVKSNKLTLSIGDGANDVNMIRTAHVGVGIEGLEGKQASMAADFSIGRFKYLVRLLFVHGHWNYDRLAVMTLYNFFKNSNLIFVLFWYQIFCMFSGQSHIDQIYLITFALLFTSLPPIAVGILDQDLPDHVLMAHPRLYQQGPQTKLYHKHSYWLHIADSLYQSLVVFFMSYLHYADSDIGVWSFGTIQTTALLVSQLAILGMETRSWQWTFVLSNVLSIGCFGAFVAVLGAVCLNCDPPSNPYGVSEFVGAHADSWLIIFLTVVVAISPRLTCLAMANTLYPTDVIYTRTLMLNSRRNHRTQPHMSVQFPNTSRNGLEPV